MILHEIDSHKPRLPALTDSSGRGQHRQRHGGVFVRVCGTGRCGECVIEVPQLIIVPLFGAGVHGAEEQPEQVILKSAYIQWLHERCQCVAGFALILPLSLHLSQLFRLWRVGWSQTDGAMIKKMLLSNQTCSAHTGCLQIMTLQLVRCQGNSEL